MKFTRMLGDALSRELPRQLQRGGLVIHCDPQIDPDALLVDLGGSMGERSHRRIIEQDGVKLFCKHKRIGGLAKRLEIMFSANAVRRFRPFMEVRNNLAIRAHANAELLAVAIFHERGIVRSFSIISRYLDGHVSAEQYLQNHPDRAVVLTCGLLEMIREMHSHRIAHMDLWLGNVMACEKTGQLSAIDHEYTLLGSPRTPQEILGFQLGFLYSKSLQERIDTQTYCDLIENCFPAAQLHPDFQRTYEHFRQMSDISEARLALIARNYPAVSGAH